MTKIPSTPPPEVLEAMAVASQVYDDLQARGRQLHFALDPQLGGVTVALKDTQGNVLSALSLSRSLKIASGETLA